MSLNPFLNFWYLWELQHKAVFDGFNKLIYISQNVTEIDIRSELYSDWKEWILASVDNAKWLPAFRSTGGDPLPGDQFLGRTFFLINGWRIVADHGVNFTGNLYTEEGDSAFIAAEGAEVATTTVSTLVVENSVPATVPAIDVADAVWDYDASTAISGSIGEVINNLNLSQIMAVGSTQAGSTTSSIQTDIIKANNYYDGMMITISSGSSNNVSRRIDQYSSTGQIDVIGDLPFTPSAGTAVLITNNHDPRRGNIR